MSGAADFFAKADVALRSAHRLLELDDLDGTTNRAYYAMFDAARAALLWAKVPIESIKSHSSIISAFGMHLVKTGMVDPSLGKAFNRAEDLRLLADYSDGPVEPEHVQRLVADAEIFVSTLRVLCV